MTITPEKLAEWKALCESATPGPWCPYNVGSESEPMMSIKAARIAGREPGHEVALCCTGDSPQEMEDANAQFIALARTAMPDLIKEVEKLNGQISHMRAAAEGASTALDAERAKAEKLAEALRYYQDQHCEGFSDCGTAEVTNGDCHGCVATRALAEYGR